MNLYGIPRTTVDIDIMVDLEEDNLRKFLECMMELGLKFKQPVTSEDVLDPERRRWIVKSKGAYVLTLYNPEDPLEHVDFFIKQPMDFSKAYSRRKRLGKGNFKLNVIHPEDLIAMKLASGRKIDLMDVQLIRSFLHEDA